MGRDCLPRTTRAFVGARGAMRAVAALVVLLAAGSAPPARAQDWTTERPDDISRFGLAAIVLEGDLPVPESQLRDVLRSSASGIFRFRAVDTDRLEGDAQRIRAHLRRLGYWKCEVSLELQWDPPRRATRAVFRVAPMAQRIVGGITTAGNRTFGEAEVLSWITQSAGAPFDISRTDRDRTAIENTYANRGFYEVRVIADIQAARDDPASAVVVHDLVYRIEEGPRFVVGVVRIEGNGFTESDIIRRELTIRPGETLSRDAIDESRERLYSTGYFSFVSIVPEEASQPESVGVVVRVTERKMRFVGAGVGYGTRDQLRLSGEWGHRNLWGRGKRGSVRGLLATELFPADLVRTGIEGRYVEPWLLGTRTLGSVELSYERRREFSGDEEYDLSLVSLLVNVSRQLTRHTRGWATLENEWADVDAQGGFELPDDRRPELTRTFTLTGERDRRNDYFDPTRGFFHRVIGGFSGGPLGGDADFWRGQMEGQWFRTAGPVTLAGRLRAGYERPFGPSTFVPDRDRFKLGGPTTVRGYDYQAIGPGDFLLLGNLEMRAPLFWRLSLGTFLDAGNAWEDLEDVRGADFRPTEPHDDPDTARESDVRYSVGAGVRVATPVGPVRVDVARKLKILPVEPGEPDDEARWGYDFSLGHVF
jgi:outer membrane protein insertion porin family